MEMIKLIISGFFLFIAIMSSINTVAHFLRFWVLAINNKDAEITVKNIFLPALYWGIFYCLTHYS